MRPEILFPLFAPITSLKGVGPRVAPLLERVAGPIVRDVLFLKPHAIVRRTRECGVRNSTSRTIGPASLSSKVATRGPTPFSEVTGAKSGNRISGRILGA